MFLGHPNFTSWLNTKLLTKYGRKRFGIQDPAQRQAYIRAHQSQETQEWITPIDLKRVSFTNLSQYNTEYSVLKYLLETELDVLQQPPYNQLTVYTEVIENNAPDTFIKPIDDDSFLVGIYSGRIQALSHLFLASDAVPNILESLTSLTKINATFLKSFAMELAVKATIYTEFASIFNQHPTLKNSQQTPNQDMPNAYKNDVLVGDFLTREIESRIQLMLESSFFDATENDGQEDQPEDDQKHEIDHKNKADHAKETLANEVRQLCIASLYLYCAQQHKENETPTAEESVFCLFHSLTAHNQDLSDLMLKTMSTTQPIIEHQGWQVTASELETQFNTFTSKIQNS